MREKRWYYKNFNMVIELDIAGEFIYNGIQELNRMTYFTNDAPAFFSLYNISVGIERLQKIILVLWKLDDNSDIHAFEESLITHSHCGLNDEIKKCTNNLVLNNRENDFLLLLNNFYKTARYNRFNINERNDDELALFSNYIKKYIGKELDSFYSCGIIMSDEIKDILGRVIGSLSRKYYKLVEEGSNKNNTYTYELRSDSKAQKIFLEEYRKNSLMQGQLNERIAFKEVLIYLRNSKDHSAFFNFMDQIPPLEFDPALIIEYLGDLSNCIVPQALIDEVEHLYNENNYTYERIELVDLIGKLHVQFDYPFILECNNLMQKIIDKKSEISDIVENIKQQMIYIEEAEIQEILEKLIDIYKEYDTDRISIEDFLQQTKKIKEEYQIFIHYATEDE